MFEPFGDVFKWEVEQDDWAAFVHDGAVLRQDGEAAACCDDLAAAFGQRGEHFRFAFSEGGFSISREEFGDGASEILFKEGVHIDEREIGDGGESGSNSGFTCSHESCEEDVVHKSANELSMSLPR